MSVHRLIFSSPFLKKALYQNNRLLMLIAAMYDKRGLSTIEYPKLSKTLNFRFSFLWPLSNLTDTGALVWLRL